MDTVFLVTGLDQNYNLRRVERFIAGVWDGGSTPFLIFNKSDVCENVEQIQEEVQNNFMGVEYLFLSAKNDNVKEKLFQYMESNKTYVFIGSSGVGKSTMINSLKDNEIQKVNEIGISQKGKHTTTTSDLIFLENQSMIIDTPGMREYQLWVDEKTIEKTFDEIHELSYGCKYSDCTHITEPGCRVKKAVENGEITEERYNNYLKMRREAENLDKTALKKKQKNLSKIIKNMKKIKKSIE